jgi:Tol biopolymer transport system component
VRSRACAFVFAVLVASCTIAGPAHATFPGTNGKLAASIAFETLANERVYTFNTDGTGQTPLTDGTSSDSDPAWSSPDGTKIAFTRAGGEIYVMNADGTNQTRVAAGSQPSWSPGSTHIVFTSGDEIYKMNADGTNQIRLTNQPGEDSQPAWSPDGTKIAFVSARRGGHDIFLMNADGSGQTLLADHCSGHDNVPDLEESPNWSPDGKKIAFWGCSAGLARSFGQPYDEDMILSVDVGTGTVTQLVANCCVPFCTPGSCNPGQRQDPNFDNRYPAWSPDGKKIAFASDRDSLEARYDIYIADADGANRTRITQIQGRAGGYIDWAAGLLNYARPQGATPTRVALVPAHEQCATANTSHQSPLAYPSCIPATQSSGWLTVGTPDANGQPAKSVGSVTVRVIVGDPATPANEADLSLAVSLTDVRKKADLADYTGQLELVSSVRVTDKRNLPAAYTAPGTLSDFPFSLTLGCVATSDTTVGSTCTTTATANALLPNSLKEGRRAIWQLGAMQLFDGGSDGVASTDPNTLFATDGVFIP